MPQSQTDQVTVSAKHCPWFAWTPASELDGPSGAGLGPYGEDSSYKPVLIDVPPWAKSYSVTAAGSWHNGPGTFYDPDGYPDSTQSLTDGRYQTNYTGGNAIDDRVTRTGELVGAWQIGEMTPPPQGSTQLFAIGKLYEHGFVPEDAKKLVLGFHDGFEWTNNVGSVDATITWYPVAVPEELAPCDCPGPCGEKSNGHQISPASVGDASGKPVRYGSGELVVSENDLAGFFSHTRSFSSKLSSNVDIGNGYNWQINELPHIRKNENGDVAVMRQATETFWFKKTSESYAPSFSLPATLSIDPVDGNYVLTFKTGVKQYFRYSTGAFIKETDLGGNSLEAVQYAANNFSPLEVQQKFQVDGEEHVNSLLYTYDDPNDGMPRITTLTLRHKEASGSWENLQQVSYTYYSVGEIHGAEGDLKTVTTQSWDGNAWANTGTTYYRYWIESASNSSSSSSSGASSENAPHLLKYMSNRLPIKRWWTIRRLSTP